MAVYSKETALFKNGAIADDILDAKNNAEAYMTDVSSSGVFVHEYDENRPTPSTSGANGVHIYDKVDIVRNGEVVASYGQTAVIGRKNDSEAYVEVESKKLSIHDNTQAPIFECEGDISERTVYTEQTIPRRFDTVNQTVIIPNEIKPGGNIRISARVNGSQTTYIKDFTEGTSGSQFYEVGFSLIYDASVETITLSPSGGTSCRFDQLFYEVEEPAPTLYFGSGNHAGKGDTALFGVGLHAYGEGQTIVGRYNEWDRDGKYAFIVGNGELIPPEMSTTDLSNAFAVEWTGNIVTSKDIDTSNAADIFSLYDVTAWDIVVAECVRRSHTVQLHIQLTNKSAISVGPSGNITDINVGTLVSSLRPHMLTMAHSHGNYAGQQWYYISKTGEVALTALEGTGASRTIDANTRFDILAVYIVD